MAAWLASAAGAAAWHSNPNPDPNPNPNPDARQVVTVALNGQDYVTAEREVISCNLQARAKVDHGHSTRMASSHTFTHTHTHTHRATGPTPHLRPARYRLLLPGEWGAGGVWDGHSDGEKR